MEDHARLPANPSLCRSFARPARNLFELCVSRCARCCPAGSSCSASHRPGCFAHRVELPQQTSRSCDHHQKDKFCSILGAKSKPLGGMPTPKGGIEQRWFREGHRLGPGPDDMIARNIQPSAGSFHATTAKIHGRTSNGHTNRAPNNMGMTSSPTSRAPHYAFSL